MAEQNDPRDEGAVPEQAAAPAAEPPPAPPGEPGDRAAVHAHEGVPPRNETLTQAPPPTSGRWSGRARRWSGNATVRIGAVTLVAGLIGGLIGGGIVAAFSDDGHNDRSGPVRFQRGMQRGGPPGFRGGPRYFNGPRNGRNMPNGPGFGGRIPATPAPPATPSPKASG